MRWRIWKQNLQDREFVLFNHRNGRVSTHRDSLPSIRLFCWAFGRRGCKMKVTSFPKLFCFLTFQPNAHSDTKDAQFGLRRGSAMVKISIRFSHAKAALMALIFHMQKQVRIWTQKWMVLMVSLKKVNIVASGLAWGFNCWLCCQERFRPDSWFLSGNKLHPPYLSADF